MMEAKLVPQESPRGRRGSPGRDSATRDLCFGCAKKTPVIRILGSGGPGRDRAGPKQPERANARSFGTEDRARRRWADERVVGHFTVASTEGLSLRPTARATLRTMGGLW